MGDTTGTKCKGVGLLMEVNISDKGKYLLKVAVSTAVVYFALKYLLPLFFPFLAAYLLAHILMPMVNYCERRFHVNRKISTAILLLIVSAVIAVFFGYIIYMVKNQIKSIVNNIDYYQNVLDDTSDQVCCRLGKLSGFPKAEIKSYVNAGMEKFVNNNQSDTAYKIMNQSVNTIIGIIEFIVIIFTTIVAAFYIVVDRAKNKERQSSNALIREVTAVLRRVYRVGIAYVKTQLIIMAITSTICLLSFLLIKNQYALLIAIVVGALDALPLFGIGVILLPWSLVQYFTGDYYRGTVILITFIICYVVREVMEPKIMGDQIGITPLATIISMYVGYKVFGLIGVILGPVGYIMLTSIMEPTTNSKDEKTLSSKNV